MLAEGLKLTVIGISIVFIFLSLMIIVMKLTHRILLVVNRYFPEKKESMAAAGAAGNQDEIAVVLAAVEAFRKK